MPEAVAAPAAAAPTQGSNQNTEAADGGTESSTGLPIVGQQSSSAPKDLSALLAQIDSDDTAEALQRELLKRKPVTIKTKHGEKKVDDFNKLVEHTRRRETFDEDLKRMAEERRQLSGIQQRLEAVQNGDPQAIQELLSSNKGAMSVVAKMLHEQYEREQQLAQLDPQQRQMAEQMQQMRAQLEHYQQQEMLLRQQQEQQEREQLSARAREEVTGRAASILRAMGYKNGSTGASYALRTLVPILREIATAGVDVPDQQIVEMVKNEHSGRVKEEFDALSGEELLAQYPGVATKILDAIRAKRQAEVGRLQPVAQTNTQTLRPSAQTKQDDDFDERMKKMGIRW